MTTQTDLANLDASLVTALTSVSAGLNAVHQANIAARNDLTTGIAAIKEAQGYAASVAADVAASVTPPPPALTIASVPAQNDTVGVASTSVSFNATGGTPPYTFAVTGEPAGLSLSGSTLSGTPTTAGNYTTTVTVTDEVSDTAYTSFAVDVAASVAPPTGAKIYMGMFPAGWPPATFMARFGGVEAGTLLHIYDYGTTWSAIQAADISVCNELKSWNGPTMLNGTVALPGQSGFGTAGSTPGTGTLSYSAAALATFQSTAKAMIAANVRMYRHLWEFNISTTAPNASTYTGPEFVAFWEYLWNVFSAEAVAAGLPADWFQFVWNPNGSWAASSLAASEAYLPAAEYVAWVGPDFYDGRWPWESSNPEYDNGWEVFSNVEITASQFTAMAKQLNAGIIIPEWGMQTGADAPIPGDDPEFVTGFWGWATANAEAGIDTILCVWAGSNGEQTTEGSWDITTFPNSATMLLNYVTAGIESDLVATTDTL